MANPSRINNYATVGAVILSVVAIAVSLLEVSAMRDQQRASVWPYLSVQQSYLGDRFSMTIENKGVGPALIERVDWRHNGEEITNLDQLILDTVGPELAFSYDTYRTSDPSNDVLAPGEEAIVFAVPIRDDTLAFLRGLNNRVTLEACYCSIHGECWTAALDEGGAEDVERCS